MQLRTATAQLQSTVTAYHILMDHHTAHLDHAADALAAPPSAHELGPLVGTAPDHKVVAARVVDVTVAHASCGVGALHDHLQETQLAPAACSAVR